MTVHKTVAVFYPLTLLAIAGCQPAAETVVNEGQSSSAPADIDGSDSRSESGDTVELTPGNTSVEFVGSHIVENGPDPNARHGSFKSLSGLATMTNSRLTSVSVEIDAESLETGEARLDAHLKSPDFFDVREHPKLTFESTSIASDQNGNVTITGDLTLLNETKSISFPATVNTEGDLELSAELTIDRTEFGMTFGTDKVEKDVSLSITIQK